MWAYNLYFKSGLTAKYTWQDYKTNADILSELKISPEVNPFISTVINVHMFGEWTETDKQTATLNYEISTMWETKPRTAGPQQVTRTKTLQVIR